MCNWLSRRMGTKWRHSIVVAFALLLLATAITGRSQDWQKEFVAMPLAEAPRELNRTNAARLMLGAFKANAAVKALIFMPGATDELYFFDRDKAKLTNAAPTLLDAIAAYTNQTRIRAVFRPPFLLLHSAEDTLASSVVIEDAKTAEKLRGKTFAKQFLSDDQPWEFIKREVGWNLNINVTPGGTSEPSYHFYRHTLAGFGLNGMEAIEAVSLAGKTVVTVKKRALSFIADIRFHERPESSADRVKRLLERKESEGGGKK